MTVAEPTGASCTEPGEDLTSYPVVVTGSVGALGRRVTTSLAAGTVTDLAGDDLAEQLAGAATVVHLDSTFGPDRGASAEADDVTLARRLLAAATEVGVDHLVVLSSATVYGAWANNPVPLTEDAPMRPHPRFAYAVQRAEIERLVAEWVAGGPGSRTAAVLRPVPAGSADEPGWLIAALRAAGAVKGLDEDPPAQFLSLDDLAAAVVTVTRQRAPGVFNVAPDGWLNPTRFRELAGARARLRVPQRLAEGLEATARRFGLVPTVPGARSYASGTWVVANDRLRALGWVAAETNEEAYVGAVPGGPWAMASAGRRQALALGAGAVSLGLTAGLITALRRRRGPRGRPRARQARSARGRLAGW